MGTNGSFYQNGILQSTTDTGVGNVAPGAAIDPTKLLKVNNLSDVLSIPGTLVNLGLDQVNNTSDIAKPLSIAATSAMALLAPLASAALTGIPTAPTALPLASTTQLATTAYADAADTVVMGNVNTALALKAPLASPALTGTPTAPTASVGTNTTQLATTAFVLANSGAGNVTATGGSTALSSADHFGFQKTVKDFGAVGNGTTADGTSIAAAITGDNQVIFPKGTYRISSTTTWSAGKVYIFLPGASLTVDSGVTLTIAGQLVASPYAQIFTGAGTVQGIRDVYAEWWGAVADNATHSAAAITKAIASVQNASNSDGSKYRLTFNPGNYLLESNIVFQPAFTRSWIVEGAGHLSTRLISLSTSTGWAFQVDSVNTSDFRISGFALFNQTAGSGASIGLYVSHQAGYQQSLFSNVLVSGFSNCIWVDQPSRLVKFERCSTWPVDNANVETSGANGLHIAANTASTFVGDLDFIHCQFKGAYGATGVPNGISASLESVVSGGNISGIRFIACVFYGSLYQLAINVQNGGIGGDFWVSNCQFEAPPRGGSATRGIYLTAGGSSATKLIDVHIDHNYLVGNGFDMAILALISGGATAEVWSITNNWPNATVNQAFKLDATGGVAKGISVSGNICRDCGGSGGYVFMFYNVLYSTVTGNTAYSSTGVTGATFVYTTSSSDYFAVSGNNGSGMFTTPYSLVGTHNLSTANNI